MVKADANQSRRRTAAEVPEIKSLRFLPLGVDAALINIGSTGLLAESTTRLRVGSSVQVRFEGGFEPSTAAGRVMRCEVAVIGKDSKLRYHIGIAFDSAIPIEDAPAEAPSAPPVPEPAVVAAVVAAPPPPPPVATVVAMPAVASNVVRNRW